MNAVGVPLRRAVLAVGLLWTALGCGGYTITKVDDAPERAAAPAKAKGGGGGGSSAPTKTAPRGQRGQIQLTTAAGVQMLVDGVPITYDLSQGYVAEVAPGQHQVEVVNLLGKVVGSDVPNVPAGQRVRYRYAKKVLSKESTVPASAMPAPAPAVAVAPTPAAPQVGSVQLDGLTPFSDRVWVDGREVPFTQSYGSYIGTNLTAGTHELRVERGGQVVYQGPLGIRAAENHRCLATVGFDYRWTLDCHFTRPAL